MTGGDRQPVSFCSALGLVSLVSLLRLGSAFSLLAGSFLMLSLVKPDRCSLSATLFWIVYR